MGRPYQPSYRSCARALSYLERGEGSACGSGAKNQRSKQDHREAVRMFLGGSFPLFSCWPSTWTVLSSMLSCSEIYRRFTGGFARNRACEGILCQQCALCETCKCLVQQGFQRSR